MDKNTEFLLKEVGIHNHVCTLNETTRRLSAVCNFIGKTKKRSAISKQDILTMESFHSSAVKRDIRSFTDNPTHTNLHYTIEKSQHLAGMLRGGMFLALSSILAAVAFWLLTGKSKDSGGSGGGGFSDNGFSKSLNNYTVSISRQASLMDAVSNTISDIVDELTETLQDPYGMKALVSHIRSATHNDGFLKAAGEIGLDITLDNIFMNCISEHVKKPFIFGLLDNTDHVSKVVLSNTIQFVKDVFVIVDHDLQKLNQAITDDSDPKEIVNNKQIPKSLDLACTKMSIDLSLDPSAKVAAMRSYYTLNLTNTDEQRNISHKNLTSGSFTNAVDIIHEMIDMEQNIEDRVTGFSEEAKKLKKYAEEKTPGNTEHILYKDAVEKINADIVLLTTSVSCVRAVENAMAKLKEAVTSATNEFIKIMHEAEATIKEDKKIDAEHRERAVRFIKTLVHGLNEDKDKK